MFSVCLSVHISGAGGPHPADRGGVPHPRSRWGGTPFQVQTGGYPIPGPGGYPILGPGRGCLPRVPPHLAGCAHPGYPPAQQGGTCLGYPPPGRGRPPRVTPAWQGAPAQGTPHLAGGTCPGYPPPSRGHLPRVPPTWQGVPARGTPPHQEQHSVYLLRGGRYASCVHAGGLSCLNFIRIYYPCPR